MRFDVEEVTRKVLAAANAGRHEPITEADVRPVVEKVKRELDAAAVAPALNDIQSCEEGS